MKVDFTDAKSIAAWFRVNPKRHGQQIAAFARLWPQFASSIAEAGRLLKRHSFNKPAQPEAKPKEAA